MSKKIYKNEIQKVIYNEDFKKVPLKIFTPNERNNLMAICSKLKKKWTEEVVFTFEELKILTNWTKKDKKSFIETIKSTNEKLMSLKNEVRIGSKEIQFVFFPKFIIDRNKEILTVQVQQEFAYLLNDFTRFNELDLEIYTNLSSNYSKDIFEELMNFRKSGIKNFKIEDFKNFLNIPTSYRMYDIDRRILKVVEKELKPHFEKFEIEKVKNGRIITNIIFKFKFVNISYYVDKDIENMKIAETTTTEEELRDFFIDNFRKYGINWTTPIKKSLFKNLKNNNLSYMETYLMRLWKELDNQKNVKDKNALFVQYIIDERDIPNPEPSKEKEKVNPVIEKLFVNEEKTEDNGLFINGKKVTEDNFYQQKIFSPDQKESGLKIEKIKITQEEYNKLEAEYIEKFGMEREIGKKTFKLGIGKKYEIIEEKTVDEFEEKYNSYDEDFKNFYPVEILKNEIEMLGNIELNKYFEVKEKVFLNWKKMNKKIIKNIERDIEKIATTKTITPDNISAELLLGKNGKELKGIARTMRIRKILDELNK